MATNQDTARHGGERLMIVGGIVTAVGMVLTLIAMIPLFNSHDQMPSYFWALAMVTGIGLAVLVYGFWRAARARGKRIRAAAADFDSQRTN